MGIVSFLLVAQGKWIPPEWFILFLFFPALIIKRARSFIFDWIPFLFILIAYDFLRGFTNDLNKYVHYFEMINAEKFIFHTIPTVYLQQNFFDPHSLKWYDYLSTIVYLLHFALPLGFAFILWLKNRQYFKEFTLGLLLLSYGALATFLIFPAAPPWMASQLGYIQPVQRILFSSLNVFHSFIDLPTIYNKFNPNPVAAIPSLHAAYPFFVFLFALRYFKLKSLLFLPYVLITWLSIIYLGEHYFIDVMVGVLYACVFYFLSFKLFRYARKTESRIANFDKTLLAKATWLFSLLSQILKEVSKKLELFVTRISRVRDNVD